MTILCKLHQRKNVSKVELSGKVKSSNKLKSSDIWVQLERENNPSIDCEQLYMCTYCKTKVCNDKLPPRSVLNGLTVVNIPDELAKLDPLSCQLIQKTKASQTIVRLGTYNPYIQFT